MPCGNSLRKKAKAHLNASVKLPPVRKLSTCLHLNPPPPPAAASDTHNSTPTPTEHPSAYNQRRSNHNPQPKATDMTTDTVRPNSGSIWRPTESHARNQAESARFWTNLDKSEHPQLTKPNHPDHPESHDLQQYTEDRPRHSFSPAEKKSWLNTLRPGIRSRIEQASAALSIVGLLRYPLTRLTEWFLGAGIGRAPSPLPGSRLSDVRGCRRALRLTPGHRLGFRRGRR